MHSCTHSCQSHNLILPSFACNVARNVVCHVVCHVVCYVVCHFACHRGIWKDEEAFLGLFNGVAKEGGTYSGNFSPYPFWS